MNILKKNNKKDGFTPLEILKNSIEARKNNQKSLTGFTLIELLVVIAIIGLLSTIVMVSLNSARTKARNANRNAAIKQLSTAFNMAADANSGTFPNTSGSWVCVSASCYSGWASYAALAAVDSATSPYIQKPVDPPEGIRNYGGYLYNSSWGTTGYPTGDYLTWMLEPSATNCGIGGPIYWSNSNNVQCVAKID